MNICQHCGTELENKRAKNCPTCATLMQEAYKRGGYDLAMAAVADAKATGLTGSDVQHAIRQAASAGSARENDRINKQRELNKARIQRNSDYLNGKTARPMRCEECGSVVTGHHCPACGNRW